MTAPLALPAAGEVHVWHVGVPEAEASGVGQHLNAEELARAARFRVEAPRRRFVATRGVLRRLLGRYLDAPPARLALAPGRNGKPELADRRLHFSVSHSGDRALVAIACDRPLGVDLEQIRPAPDLLEIARRYFAEAEASALAALADAERPAAFFALWTRKEACLKVDGEGLGSGLARPLDAFRPVTARGLDVVPGYCAAVAAAGETWRVLARAFAAA